ncbi:MAG TPA: hypothetical protein VNF93_02210 [Buchnera sp. (in: enterobacteria)]|nr:hypothetical protein [Buchnera sp. (in: enterobacteria)]
MSSISVLNQTQLLDIKNKIQTKENKKITGRIQKRDLSNPLSPSLSTSTVVNLISEKKSDLYTVSPIDVSLNKKNVSLKEYLDEYKSSIIDSSKFNQYINSLPANQSTDEDIKLISQEINEEENKVSKVANKIINIGEKTFFSSVSFTKKMIHTLMHHFNKESIDQIFDEKIINNIIKREEKISIDKINNNEMISAGDINSNEILPGKKHSINDISFHQSKYNNLSSIDKTLNNAIDWKPLNSLNQSSYATSFANQYQENFYTLKHTKELDKNFIYTGEHSLLTVNGNKISKVSPITMLHGFKKIIPNLESRQLLSSYIHPGIFTQAYYDVYSRHPDISEYEQKKPVIVYNVQELNNGKFKLVATNTAELIPTKKNTKNKYNILGIKTSILISKNQTPQISYSSFLQ